MPKRIIITRPDGCVLICAPSALAMAYMTGTGGRWTPPLGKMWLRWERRSYLVDVPHGFRHLLFPVPLWFLNAQIAAQTKDCANPTAAARFVHAMQFGGCSADEAYDIMSARFCAHLGACELWDTKDVPTDRAHRDEWRRSHNGGPIWIDETKATEIDERRAWDAYERLSGQRSLSRSGSSQDTNSWTAPSTAKPIASQSKTVIDLDPRSLTPAVNLSWRRPPANRRTEGRPWEWR